MPIPTDTYRNVRVLNWIFAATSLVLLLLLGASVMQDYHKSWRQPQQSGELWQAAMVDDKVARALTPEKKARLDDLAKQIARHQKDVDAHKAEVDQIKGRIAKIRSDIATKEFSLNNEKSTLGVAEAQLEQARTAATTDADREHVREMEQKIQPKRQYVAGETEQIKAWSVDVEKLNGELGKRVGALAELEKTKTKLEADEKALRKKRDALEPRSMTAKLSAIMRRTPLMQFINPAEKVQQDVLPDVRTDVAFQKITTIDRCRTCHVNIDDKQFTEPNVLAFLERNVAEDRGMKLPAARPTRPADPQATADLPGAAAMGEFWHAWGVELGPQVVRRNAARIKALADTVGSTAPKATVTVDGQALPAFSYDLNLAITKSNEDAAKRQDRILVALMKAWSQFDPAADAVRYEDATSAGRVRVDIPKGASGGAAAKAAALKYPEDVRTGLEAALDRDARRLLLDRYRRSLTAAVNVGSRRRRGEPALDDGRAMLAHPKLELYVGVDSKHPFDKVGCTSCHDGSGQETDFVLTAHTARPIWVDQRTGAPVLPEQLRPQTNGTSEHDEHPAPTMASMLDAVYPESALAPFGASSLQMPFAASVSAHVEPASHSDSHPTTAPAAVAAPEPDAHHKAHFNPEANPTPYVDPVTGATGRAVPQIRYWAKKYEFESGDAFEGVHHRWDWPMREPQFLEANCVRCHTQVSDIRDEAPTLNEGRTLFANLGCANCHQMDSIPAEQKRQVGPDLRHVADKLSADFINTWVWAPKAFRPSTKMPHFFMLENNSSDEEIRRTRQEARSITEYLIRTSIPMPLRHQVAPTAKGSAEAGQKLFETVGCLGCHVNLNAPTKTRGVTVAQQWITTDLVKGGELAERLEPLVAKEVAERLTSGVAADTEKALIAAATKQVTDAVTKELTPPRPTGAAARTAPKPTPQEQAELKAKIDAEVKNRLPAALDKAKAGLTDAIAKAQKDLPTKIESTVRTDLAKRVDAEAKAMYDRMTYNERQLYLMEHLEPPSILMEKDPEIPWRGDPPKPRSPYEVPTYSDGTPKPVFMHHGPELSGIGTKLTAGRTPDDARAWLFSWLKEPHHYSSYTLMPNLRLTDQQALDLAEYLLAQKREANKPGDAWKAELAPEDPAKLSELAAFFLRSRFSLKTADQKAVEEFITDGSGKQSPGEITKLAIDALTTPATPRDEAEAQVAKMNLQQKQMAWLGKKLIGHYGCMSCHQINGMETATSPCANLSDWGQKGIDKLDFAYLDHHKHVGPDALPETYNVQIINGLSEQASHVDVPPAGAAKVSQTISVAWPHVGHSREEWITQKLKNSRVYDRGKNLLEPDPRRGEGGKLENPGRPYDKLRMPTFYLNDQQAHAIVTFVISNRDRLISDALTMKATNDEAKQIAYGRFLTQKYNCISCHPVERNAPPVRQYYSAEDVVTKAPPSLRGEGNRIQHAWLFNFLRNVEPLRPLPQIRMPSFHFASDAEVTAIAAYFASLSNREARDLKRSLDLVQAHIDTAQKATAPKGVTAAAAAKQPAAPSAAQAAAATQPTRTLGAPTGSALTQNAAAVSPAAAVAAAASAPSTPPWFKDEAMDTQRKYLEDWALGNKQLTLIQLDPARNNAAELDKNYATLLFKARFTADLYNAPYPFTDATTPHVAQDRFKLGEALFFEMQCLKCHMMGEVGSDAKAPASVVAPNLSLAHRRLQRRWIRHWVQEPPIIQAGTAMPPFLSGLAALELNGTSWPRSQMLPEPEIKRIESTYGATADEQANLLLDFLFSAGARNYVPVQPAGGAVAAATPSPAPLPQGQPPTATQPKSAGDAAAGSAAGAPVDKAPVAATPPQLARPQMQQSQAPASATPQAAATAPAPTPAPAKSPTVATEKPSPAPAPSAATPTGPVSVTGKVVFKGEAPEPEQIDMAAVKECAAQHPDGAFAENLVVNSNGTLRNVMVRVTAGLPEGQTFPVPPPTKLDQRGCQYHPHVVGLMVGQQLSITNGDTFLHNVHALSNQNPAFNFGQPTKDETGRKVEPMKTAEVFKVKCDVHPWMGAYVHVLDHPFFSVTGEDGTFSLRGLPPGTYTVTAWHETLGEQQQEVKVEEGKPATVEFAFEPK